MKCRGIRGATTVDSNTKEAVLAATRELLQDMVTHNDVREEDVAAVFFTTTADLNATFPAEAARETGLSRAPLLCGQEIDVPGSLPMCLRILILYNTDKGAEDIAHVYIKGATVLKSNDDNNREGGGSQTCSS
jgi:chorismate mutase